MSDRISRRGFLGVAASGAVALPSFHVPPKRRLIHPVSVASPNGRRSVQIAVEKMKEGMSPAEAAVLGVAPVEADPNDTSVGYGGLPNARGVVALDACVMDGPSGLGGAVAALTDTVHARAGRAQGDADDRPRAAGRRGGARVRARHGFRPRTCSPSGARKRWLRWLQTHSDTDDWVAPKENRLPADDEDGEDSDRDRPPRPTGTIHVGCVNAKGDIGGCTTTSGLAFKLPGRVGDSPLIGCGNFLDNDVGVAGSTGRGEAVILSNGASTVVNAMRQGKSPTDACVEACKRIVHLTRIPRLLNGAGRPNFQVNFYAANKQGQTGAAAIYPSRHARMTENGPEVVQSAYVFESRR